MATSASSRKITPPRKTQFQRPAPGCRPCLWCLPRFGTGSGFYQETVSCHRFTQSGNAATKERGQPCPQVAEASAKTRGQGCPRSGKKWRRQRPPTARGLGRGRDESQPGRLRSRSVSPRCVADERQPHRDAVRRN